MDPIFFAKLFGLYFLIVGAVVLLRRSSVMPTVAQLLANRPLLFLMALIELAAGLSIVLAYPEVTFDWLGLISLVGYMLVVEGVIYLALPAKRMQKLVKHFNDESWYVSSGVLSVIIGAYLAGVGFGIV